MVCSLIFLSQCTRFYISFSVAQVAHYMSKLTTQHLTAVKPIFSLFERYARYAHHLQPLQKQPGLEKCFCDSSYGNSGTKGKMRSTKGTMFFLVKWTNHFFFKSATDYSHLNNRGRAYSPAEGRKVQYLPLSSPARAQVAVNPVSNHFLRFPRSPSPLVQCELQHQ
ncbi:unnamed protein product [Sphacelaria rigidula]